MPNNLSETNNDETPVKTDLTEQEVFGKLTAKQSKYVRCWITGDYTKSEAYCEAYGKKRSEQNKQSIAASATRTHQGQNVQRAIAWLVSRENRKALMTRHEKRLFLAGVVRAATDIGRKLNPNDPLNRLDPLSAIKIDNDMSGDNAAQQVESTVSIASIMKNLPSDAIVSRPVGNVPIQSAGGGFGVIDGGQDGVQLPADDGMQEAAAALPAGPFAER